MILAAAEETDDSEEGWEGRGAPACVAVGAPGWCCMWARADAAPDVLNDDMKMLSRAGGRLRQGECVAFLFFCFWPSLGVSHLKNVLEDVRVTVLYPN